jgi:hypothetical protein
LSGCSATGSNSSWTTAAVALTYTGTNTTFPLTVRKAGTGAGTVTSSPAGINCGSACSHAYPANAIVTLTAKAKLGSRFAGWAGACTGTSTCKTRMNAARTVAATFKVIPPPRTQITGKAISSAKRKATFDFKGSGGVGTLHFQCKIDSGAWQGCTSPKTYSGLARKSHTFEVRAVDSRGKADPSPAELTFTI